MSTASIPDRLPNGLPHHTLNTLSSYQRRLVVSGRRESIKRCAVCSTKSSERPLWTCSGCRSTRIRRIFYCSRDCQKGDWITHRLVCGKDHGGPEDFGLPQGREASKERAEARCIWLLLENLRPTIEWAASQAFRSSRVQQSDGLFVYFHFIPGDLDHGGDLVSLIRVHFFSLQSEFAVPEFTASTDQSIGYYLADISSDQDFQMSGSIPFPETTEIYHGIHFPLAQWPWILYTIAFKGCSSKGLAEVMLTVLTEAIKGQLNTGMLNLFTAPPFRNIFKIPFVQRWIDMTFKVVDFGPGGVAFSLDGGILRY